VTVLVAMSVNVALAAAKSVAAFVTGSASMLAEPVTPGPTRATSSSY